MAACIGPLLLFILYQGGGCTIQEKGSSVLGPCRSVGPLTYARFKQGGGPCHAFSTSGSLLININKLHHELHYTRTVLHQYLWILVRYRRYGYSYRYLFLICKWDVGVPYSDYRYTVWMGALLN